MKLRRIANDELDSEQQVPQPVAPSSVAPEGNEPEPFAQFTYQNSLNELIEKGSAAQVKMALEMGYGINRDTIVVAIIRAQEDRDFELLRFISSFISRTPYVEIHVIISNLISYNDLELLNELINLKIINRFHANEMNTAVTKGNLDVFKFVIDHGVNDGIYSALEHAILRYGDDKKINPMVAYLVNEMNGQVHAMNDIFNYALARNNLNLANLVHEKSPNIPKSVSIFTMDKLVKDGDIELLQYIFYNLDVDRHTRLADIALEHKNLDVLDLLLEQGYEPHLSNTDYRGDSGGMINAFSTGDLDYIKEVHEKYGERWGNLNSGHSFSPIDFKKAYEKYRQDGDSSVCDFLKEIGVRPSPAYLHQAVKDLDMFKELLLKYDGGVLHNTITQLISSGQYKYIEVIVDNNKCKPESFNSNLIKNKQSLMAPMFYKLYEGIIKANGELIFNSIAFNSFLTGYMKSYHEEIFNFIKSKDDIRVQVDCETLANSFHTKNNEIIKFIIEQSKKDGIAPSYQSINREIEIFEEGELSEHPEVLSNIKLMLDLGASTDMTNIKGLDSMLEVLSSEYMIEARRLIAETFSENIKQDITKVMENADFVKSDLLSTDPELLTNFQHDFNNGSRYNIFFQKGQCEDLSGFTGNQHYDPKDFREQLVNHIDIFFFDHSSDEGIQLPARLLMNILLNQGEIAPTESMFDAVLNGMSSATTLLNEALETRHKGNIVRWLKDLSSKTLFVNNYENAFLLASYIPSYIEKVQQEMEAEGMIKINQDHPEKNKVRFTAIKKLRNQIKNNSNIPISKKELVNHQKRSDSDLFGKMDWKFDRMQKVDHMNVDKDTYYGFMTNLLLNKKSMNFEDNHQKVMDIINHKNFGQGKITPETFNVNVDGRSLDFKIIEKTDPLGIVIGEQPYSACCFKLGGISENSLKEAYTNPNTGIITVHNDRGDFVAQSWIWLAYSENDRERVDPPWALVLDNIEFSLVYKNSGDNNHDGRNNFSTFFEEVDKPKKVSMLDTIREAYKDFAKQYKEKYGLSIVVGSGYDDLGIQNMGLEALNRNQDGAGNYEWNFDEMYPKSVNARLPYTDADEVYKLANWYGNYRVANCLKVNRKRILG